MTFTHDHLNAVGAALYGPLWQSQLARDLGVSVRTMQRWAGGEFDIPEGVWADLAKLCSKRSGELAKWAQKLALPR
jgi:hypothetical protein